LTFGVALAVTALAIIPAGKLRIRTDVEAMLPNGAPAAEAYRTFLDTFGGIEKVFITVRLPEGAPPDPERLADAADSIAVSLARSPEVRRVRAGLDDADEAYVTSRLAPSLPLLVPEMRPRYWRPA
jgi:predicted RND superfamily exporter protein